MVDQWNHKMFNATARNFNSLCLEAFHYQYKYNIVYRNFVAALGIDPATVTRKDQIPFLPIRFFKSHPVKTGEFEASTLFESSGTTGLDRSHHWVRDIRLYETCFTKCFEKFYGPLNEWCILGLLPSYLEREHSSLVYMVNGLIRQSEHPESGFYLHDLDKLNETLHRCESLGQKTLLMGVTFALLDLAQTQPISLRHTIVMETGGMKGRRKELVRQEVHEILRMAFLVDNIHSEYGMTELLSQAYSRGNGVFETPPWMQILLRDDEDPLFLFEPGSSGQGAINVIDLANIHSCCFIATDDAGRVHPDGSFEVLGRIDHSDIRGCSMLLV